MKRYTPLLTLITVTVDKTEMVSKGGIVLATEASREAQARAEGTVVAVGENAYQDYGDQKQQVKEGDKVMFVRYAGILVEEAHDSRSEIRVMQDKDILLKIEDTEE